MKPKLVRVLTAEIVLEVPESRLRELHGEKGATMTDADLKHFFLDDFAEMLKRDCMDGEEIKKYMHFYIKNQWKER